MSKNGKIELRNKFVATGNVRNFSVLMDNLILSSGEGQFGLVYGQAGRGKTRTAIWWHGQNESIFLRMLKIWDSRPLDFLRALAVECGVLEPGRNKGAAFAAIVDKLMENPTPVFLDEIEKLPGYFLEVIRDISDLTGAPFILIGEEELAGHMAQNRRVWTRTFERYEFEPIKPVDIMTYVTTATDGAVKLTGPQAQTVHGVAGKAGRGQKSGGDFRVVRRFLLHLVAILNAHGDDEVKDTDIKTALKIGLS